MDRGCSERNKEDGPCGATHYRDGYCRWHHPDLEEQRQAERAAGGAARSNKARAKRQLEGAALSIADIDNLLCATLKSVASGRMEPGVGNSLAMISKTITGIRQAHDLEQRLEALERAAGIGDVRRWGS